MSLRRLGLFGGTFDPPHNGHVAALEAALGTGRYDVVEVTVAGDPYRKSAEGLIHPAATRLAMARAAFAHFDHVRVSDREIRRPGPSYTVDTVEELLEEADRVDLLIGADLAAQLPTWHRAEDLREMVRVGIVPRPGTVLRAPEGWECFEIAMAPVDLSSSFLRESHLAPDDLESLMPADVIAIYQSVAE